MYSSLCVLYRIYHGECSEELFNVLPAAEFSNPTVRHKQKYIHTTWIRGIPLLCGFVGTPFHAPRNCEMAYPRQYFQVDMTWVLKPKKRVYLHLGGRQRIYLYLFHKKNC